MMDPQWLLSLIPIPLVIERVFDYMKRKHDATTEQIKKVTRAVFSQVVQFMPTDKAEARKLFLNWGEAAIIGAGWTFTPQIGKIVDEIFVSLWDSHSKAIFNSAMASLSGPAADRMDKAAKKLSEMVELKSLTTPVATKKNGNENTTVKLPPLGKL